MRQSEKRRRTQERGQKEVLQKKVSWFWNTNSSPVSVDLQFPFYSYKYINISDILKWSLVRGETELKPTLCCDCFVTFWITRKILLSLSPDYQKDRGRRTPTRMAMDQELECCFLFILIVSTGHSREFLLFHFPVFWSLLSPPSLSCATLACWLCLH